MNKRYLHHLLKQVQKLSLLYMVIAVMLSGLVFIFSYRHNNVVALKLRDKVLQVDKDNGDVETALRNLREYTYSHMNANLAGGPGSVYPPIQLKYRYERLVAAERNRVDAVNSKIVQNAQAYCEAPGVSKQYGTRVNCTQAYMMSHQQLQPNAIPDALYKFDFAAPVWSSDLAGWSLVVTALLGVVLLTRLGLEYWLRFSLRD